MLNDLITYLYELTTTPIVVILATFPAIIDALVKLISFFQSNKSKEFSYATSSYQVIRNNIAFCDDIEITHKGARINTLTVTNFAIWNSGKKLIDGSDIIPSYPLCIRAIDDSKILSARITEFVEPTNMFAVTNNYASDKSIHISFEYVDSGEGAVIQVLHTGNADSLHFEPQIKGGKHHHITTNKYYLSWKKMWNKVSLTLSSILVLLLLAIIKGIRSPFLVVPTIIISSIVLESFCLDLIFGHYVSLKLPPKLKSYSKH